ncbi:hypothetical protein ILUMI_13424 [Ignelater luminosus]|uniref:L-serine deaminase n=1 Tax=Ignelater luminosus TaxID=2038154 RepID=A0A8K0CSF8_IGNLU|nr:hypothetical protein ILUMI_13424 [Ignelater luminosus]
MEELMYHSTVDDEEEIKDPYCDPDHPVNVPYDDVIAAEAKIKDGIICTPCDKTRLSEIYGIHLYLKKDFLQYTGNFKERGARYTLLMLDDEKKKKGVVSASLGNHAQAICYHGMLLNIPTTVVMPVVAPIMKISQCKKYNATVVVQGRDMAEAKRIALRLAKNNGLTYVNGYDHPQVIAGQGTIGMEVLAQVPDVDAIIIPCGGGGLIAGVALAAKKLKPSVKIIGVESEKCPGFSQSMKDGKPSKVGVEATLADGLAVPLIGFNSFETAKRYIDRMVVVKEQSIALAILRYVEVEKCVVEGAGACGLAAVIEGQMNEFKGKKVVSILSGGNIDTTILGRCLERGLAADGRFVKAKVTISDRPGGMAELVKLIASLGANIKDILQERAWVTQDVFSVEVICICETRDMPHSVELRDLLRKHYKKVKMDIPEVCTSSKC